MIDLWQLYEETRNDLKKAVDDADEWGGKKAQTENEYRIALKKKVLELRANGEAVGIIDKTCYGYENVAAARLQRDIADAKYEVAKERINVLKLNLRILDQQMQREWSSING